MTIIPLSTVIHGHKKNVVFSPMDEEKFKLIGDPRKARTPLISALKAKKLLRSSCIGYLASVVDSTKEQTFKPEDVPVVWDYLEVFHEDLLGLPPSQEIEFEIELLPGT